MQACHEEFRPGRRGLGGRQIDGWRFRGGGGELKRAGAAIGDRDREMGAAAQSDEDIGAWRDLFPRVPFAPLASELLCGWDLLLACLDIRLIQIWTQSYFELHFPDRPNARRYRLVYLCALRLT